MVSDMKNTAGDADDVIIAALADGLNYQAAGDAAGVSARTVRRRMADEAFAAEVSARRSERISEITALLVDQGANAVQALHRALDPEEDIYPRLRAAQVALNLILKYRAAGELEDRLVAVERRLAEANLPTDPAAAEDEA